MIKEESGKFKIYVWVWILCFLYVMPIIIANRYYFDDTQRVLYHDTGWVLDGRPLTEYITRLICGMRTGVYDVFPLPLLLAITIYTVVSVNWTYKKYEVDDLVGVFTSFLPFSTPFLLSNLSYRFDCFGMVASIVVLMIPFLIDDLTGWKRVTTGICMILLSMCFYQPTVGLYAGLAILVAIAGRIKHERYINDLLCDIVSFVVGTVLYKYVIASLLVDKTGWRAQANSLVTLQSMPSRVMINVREVVDLVIMYLKSAGMKQLMLYALIFFASIVALVIQMRKDGEVSWIDLSLFCVLPILAFVVSIMPMAVLSDSYAQSRRQTGLVIILFIICIQIAVIFKLWPRNALVLGAIVALFQFSFSYAYGNMLRTQKEYEQMVVWNINDDLNHAEDRICEMVIEGNMPYSPVVKSTADMLPILYDMIPAGVDNDGMLCGAIINHYSLTEIEIMDISQEDKEYMQDNDPNIDNDVYALFFKGSKACLRFKTELDLENNL